MITSTTQVNKTKNKISSAALKTAAVLFWVLVWFIASRALGSELLLPSPLSTFKRLAELIQQKDFWLAAGFSLLRIILGCTAGIIVGTLLGAATACSRALSALFDPLLTAVRATPVASFIILALVWIKRDNVGIFIAFLMVLPIMWANVSRGVAECDRELLEMSRVFGFSKAKKLTKIYIPSVMPYFFAGCTTSIGLSWKAGVAAEVLSQPKYALGSELYYSKIYLETPSLFAVTLVVIVLSLILEKLLKLAVNKIAGWQR